MDTFTSAWLAPTLPMKGSLESIGSVRTMHERANAEAEEDSDLRHYRRESDPHANHILQMFGQEACDEYMRDVALQRQCEEGEAAEKLARRITLRRRISGIHARIEHLFANLVTNVTIKITQRHTAA